MADFNRTMLRKVFEDAGIEVPPKDVLGQICELHTSKTDEITESVKALTKRAEKAESELEAVKAQGNDDYKVKYDKEHSVSVTLRTRQKTASFDQLEEMMENADSSHRDAIRRCLDEVKKA